MVCGGNLAPERLDTAAWVFIEVALKILADRQGHGLQRADQAAANCRLAEPYRGLRVAGAKPWRKTK
jgi:hypothetical protein